jgi:hypothetical protein
MYIIARARFQVKSGDGSLSCRANVWSLPWKREVRIAAAATKGMIGFARLCPSSLIQSKAYLGSSLM